ncbi:PREDICTED: sprT-like domain-containing protein Spartan [Rhagoletis zephyria]|uniref:sprT-like domain-containing protein Spartan n=1 Tax=Rhagoletis zephyria TaxID=28612 RepID=UPI000811503C|nr:PREDICTED: sprT-like domain-containing protein Spartan [Rhagoletis zephyria]
MARKRPADDDIDWVALLDDDLDDVLTEVANKASSSSKATTSSLVAGKSSSSQPSGIEMITIGGDEEYDEDDDEQLAKAIALSLQDNSRSGSSSGSMPDVMFLPGCSNSTVTSFPSTSASAASSSSHKMSDADLAAISGALKDLEHSFNAKQAVADEATLKTIELMEIADQLELEDSKLESYNPQHAATIRSLPIVHPDLEQLDPNPDIYQLFREFDDLFFKGFLKQTALRLDWAKNFYSCAGAFYPQKDGIPTILLSANLLTLRPRRDLVETLIHEMIHAYISLKGGRDTGEHGVVFHSHMKRINDQAGTNITVYHSFNDEVSYLRKYIWRCSGATCQAAHPYRGYVSLPTKRRPSKWDKAYRLHLERGCTGTFQQVSDNFADDAKQAQIKASLKKAEQEKEREKKKAQLELEKEKKKAEREKEKERKKAEKEEQKKKEAAAKFFEKSKK